MTLEYEPLAATIERGWGLPSFTETGIGIIERQYYRFEPVNHWFGGGGGTVNGRPETENSRGRIFSGLQAV
jgi:hypothetical protein